MIVSYGNGKSFLNYIYQTTLNANPVFNGPLSTGYQWGTNQPFYMTDIDCDGLVDMFGFGPSLMHSSKYVDKVQSVGSLNLIAGLSMIKNN